MLGTSTLCYAYRAADTTSCLVRLLGSPDLTKQGWWWWQVSFALPTIQKSLGQDGTYLLFCVISIAAVASIYFTVPETKVVSCPDIVCTSAEHCIVHHCCACLRPKVRRACLPNVLVATARDFTTAVACRIQLCDILQGMSAGLQACNLM